MNIKENPILKTQIVGLTGGICSGKSEVAKIMAGFGSYIVIDADSRAHFTYSKNMPAYHHLIAEFGSTILDSQGEINRKILGQMIFSSPSCRHKLNQIIWPKVQSLIQEDIDQLRASKPSDVIIVEASLLIEAKWQGFCDQVWVTYCTPDVAIKRLEDRNGLDLKAAKLRLEAQLSNEERLVEADVSIENNGSRPELEALVSDYCRRYLPK